jgi:hypothetical protein
MVSGRAARCGTGALDSSLAQSPWVALGSPAFWVALAVLALNDHYLEGAGLVPGWLTGKLSDFAGLVVAPLGACAMLGARRVLTRVGGFALVVAPFGRPKRRRSAASAALTLSRA